MNTTKKLCIDWEIFFEKYGKYVIPLYSYEDVGDLVHISVEELYKHFRNRYNEEFVNNSELLK